MQRKYLWCPSDQHGDHEIQLTFIIHPGCAASMDGPAVDPLVEILSASEAGVERELSADEYRQAVIAIEESEYD